MRKALTLCCVLISISLLAACGSAPVNYFRPAPSPTPSDSALGLYVGGNVIDGAPSNFYALQASDGALRWKAQVSPGGSLQAHVGNGVIYVTDQNGVTALRASDGTRLWHQDVGRATVDAVADGRVYGTAYTDDSGVATIYALEISDGKVVWKSTQAGGYIERVTDGVVFVGFAPMAYPGAFGLSLLSDLDGALLWHYDVQEEAQVQQVVNNKQVYVAVSEPPNSVSDIPPGYVAALDLQTGKELWRYDPGSAGSAFEIGANDQMAYVLSNDGHQGTPPNVVYALNASDGSVQWHQQEQTSQEIVALFDGGTLFLGANTGAVTALKPGDGSEAWDAQVTPVPSGSSLTIQSAQGLLYVSVGNTGLYALNISDGSVKWHVQVAGLLGINAVTSSSLYVGSSDTSGTGVITAFNISDGSVRWTYTTADLDAGNATLG